MDTDGDGVPDEFDNCPNDFNPAQQNYDLDDVGDVCDPDDDNDGICDPGESDPSCSGSENSRPYDSENDSDEDEDICGDIDNCPDEPNPNQEDTDLGGGDGVGDVCDNCPTVYNPQQDDNYPPQGNNIGDACDCEGNFNCDGSLASDDVNAFVADTGRNTYNNPCTNGNPCNGDFGL